MKRSFKKVLAIVLLLCITSSFMSGCFPKKRLVWPTTGLATQLPKPSGKIRTLMDYTDSFYVSIEDYSSDKARAYIDACIELGFSLEPERTSTSYTAFNELGYELLVTIYSDSMTVRLDAPIQLGKYRWPAGTVGSLIPQPNSSLGKNEWDREDGFGLYIGEMTLDSFDDYINQCSNAGFNVDYDRGDTYYYADNETGYHLSLTYVGFGVMFIKIEKLSNIAPEDSKEESDSSTNEEMDDSTSDDGGQSSVLSTEDTEIDSSTNSTEESSLALTIEGISSFDELESRIDETLTEAINSLLSQWETLSTETDTYEEYCEKAERVSAFYNTIVSSTDQMCIMLKEYSAVYARMILDSTLSSYDKYNAAEGILDSLYDDACERICDDIYDGLLEDMYDYYYDGILEKQPNNVAYDDWYDVASDEYSQWYDATSDVYSLYYDTASDIYSLYYDLSMELYDGDYDRAEKVLERFLQKLSRQKGEDTTDTSTKMSFDTTLRTAATTEELEGIIETHVSECIQSLQNEWIVLSSEIDSYEKYVNNVDEIEAFHSHIEDSAHQILKMICEYGVVYAELIMQSDSSPRDKYNDFEDFHDIIYEDACEMVHDDIYDDLLGKIKKYYYEGIVKDAKEMVSYTEWANARSDTYNWWADARSEVYSAWADTRSDLFSFYADIRSELFSQDINKANKELDDFKNKVKEMY